MRSTRRPTLERSLVWVLVGFIAVDLLLIVPAFASELRLDLIHPSLPSVRLDWLRLPDLGFLGEPAQDSQPSFAGQDTQLESSVPPNTMLIPASAPTPIVHEVQPGDTLGRIARSYGSNVSAIAAANGVTDPNVIFVGQQLVIPVASTQETSARAQLPTPHLGPTPSAAFVGIQLPAQVPSPTSTVKVTASEAPTLSPLPTQISSPTSVPNSTPIPTAMATLTQIPLYTPTSTSVQTQQIPSMTPSKVALVTATVICAAIPATSCQSMLNPTSTPTAIPTSTPLPTATMTAEGASPLPAFPGAEGWGAESIGGRGGEIIEVTNLNNDGPGSLRACAQDGLGPRMCVFRVAGEIVLTGSSLRIGNPYLTIAGQTAPGGGITLRSGDASARPVINFEPGVHDVVVRYISVREGRLSKNGDGVGLRGGYNIILDHVSVEWATDEVVGVNPSEGNSLSNFTIQRSILAEALRPHSTGILMTGADDLFQITLHHNLFAHNAHRNPRVRNAKRVEFINNVIYNWHSRAGTTVADAEVDFIGNYFKAGPWSDEGDIILHEAFPRDNPNDIYPDPSIYAQENLAVPFQTDPNEDNWQLFQYHYRQGSLPTSWRRFTSIPSPIPVTLESAQGAYDSILADVGNSARLDSVGNWVPRLDIVDRNIISDVIQGTGPAQDSEIDHQDDFGGYPVINPGSPYADTDKDGMADEWERLYCFDPNDPSDGPKDADGDGYTNVEEFLNGTQPTADGPC